MRRDAADRSVHSLCMRLNAAGVQNLAQARGWPHYYILCAVWTWCTRFRGSKVSPTRKDYANPDRMRAKNLDEFNANPLQFPVPTIIVGEWSVSAEEARLDQSFVFQVVGCGDCLKQGVRQMLPITPAYWRSSATNRIRPVILSYSERLEHRGVSTE